MAPCRQLLLWSVPSIAVILGIFWFRKKREFAKSDPGGREKIKSLQQELAEALCAESEAIKITPIGKTDHAIIKSAPIDIVPYGSGSLRSSPLEMTDEEVDLEIEKIIRKKSIEKQKLSLSSENQIIYSNSIQNIKSVNSTMIGHKIPKSIDISATVSKHIIESFIDDQNISIIQKQTENMENKCSTSIVSDTSMKNSSNNVSVGETETVQAPADTSGETQRDSDQYSNVQARRISERDSANHSPVDPMLASPSMCHFSDNHSEGSSDSGKGCSEAASPPPTNINMVPCDLGLRIHQFLIPQTLVGLLIGKQGSFVTQIKAKTGASVYVKRHPDSGKNKICAVEGTQSEIEAALEMIKDKFPEKRFPHFSLQEISAELYQRLVPLVPDYLQLQLVESVNNETIMTCLVSAGHFFLQLPLHPTFPSLHALHRLMAATYQNPDVPALPQPIKEGSICAAPTENNWYRAQVISTSEENDTAVVKLVDFGGYLTVGTDQLKQIRLDFMTLPFQATEALLAFVKPANNESEWSAEALRIMAGLTAGQLLHSQVAGYNEAGLPLVHLYLTMGAQQVLFLNRELVERGLAEWDIPADS